MKVAVVVLYFLRINYLFVFITHHVCGARPSLFSLYMCGWELFNVMQYCF